MKPTAFAQDDNFEVGWGKQIPFGNDNKGNDNKEFSG
jgi:hypothetical protein